MIYKEIDSDPKILVLKNVKAINPIVANTAKCLSALDIIKFIRITRNSIQASSEVHGNKLKVPLIEAFHPTAVGIHLIYDFEFKIVEIYEINSGSKGWGGKMVEASIKHLTKEWEIAIVFDWSNGFWDKMEQKYSHFKWSKI